MMRIVLADHGKTFATRERARELVSSLSAGRERVLVEFSGVFASPSFTAELLIALVGRARTVTVVAGDEPTFAFLTRLVGQLKLNGKVNVEPGGVPV